MRHLTVLISVFCIDVCVCDNTCGYTCLGAYICQFVHIFYFDLDLSPVELTSCRCFTLDMESLLRGIPTIIVIDIVAPDRLLLCMNASLKVNCQ